jgi:hypothetical protein
MKNLKILGQRAENASAFRWMPGMLSNHNARYVGPNQWKIASGDVIISDPEFEEFPDFSDAETVEALRTLCIELNPEDKAIISKMNIDKLVDELASLSRP